MKFHVYAGPSANHCPWCEAAKKLLTEKAQNFMYYNVTETIDRDQYVALFEQHGMSMPRTVPQIFVEIGGQVHYIGGYTQLQVAIEQAYS